MHCFRSEDDGIQLDCYDVGLVKLPTGYNMTKIEV